MMRRRTKLKKLEDSTIEQIKKEYLEEGIGIIALCKKYKIGQVRCYDILKCERTPKSPAEPGVQQQLEQIIEQVNKILSEQNRRIRKLERQLHPRTLGLS